MGGTFATSRLPFSRVLGVLVRILAIRIEYDLPDAQRRWLPPQFEDGLEHDLRGIGLAGPCHPKQRGFLAEEISGRDRNGHAVDLLKRPMAGGVPHGADADHRGVGVGMRPWIPVVDDAVQRIAARLESDNRAIFAAASHAQRAADFINGLQPGSGG
jgi:hypothetical protein